MRIIDVQQFINDQYSSYRNRRVSQFIKFLDKSVDFVTYFSINKELSTYSLSNKEVDNYIGTDSPIRYNIINNFPVYGIPVIDMQNEYDDNNGGLSADSYSAEMTILADTLEPCEGDCFILNVFDENRFFTINEVRQTVLKAKPHYVVNYHIGTPDLLPQLKKQVTEEYNAIFDNIGTQDKVIVSNNEYNLRSQYIKIYKEIMDYYTATYFNIKTTSFEIKIPLDVRDNGSDNKFIDKFLTQFMEKNHIIVFDKLTKGSIILDYNALHEDYLEYKKSIFWAIENRDIRNMIPSRYIQIETLNSPFTLIKGQTNEEIFVSKKYMEVTDINKPFYVNYDYSEIVTRWNSKDTSISSDNIYSKVLSLIINYFKNTIIVPGYFDGLLGQLNPIQEYEMLPIILYIIREQINGLTKLPHIL